MSHSQSHSRSEPVVVERPSLARRSIEYYKLCKPRVVLLIVFTAMVGMFLATPGMVPVTTLICGTAGITLLAASAAAINQILDRKVDARMARTCGRPLVTHRLSPMESVCFAAVIGLLGMAILIVGVNALTAWLTLAALIGYSGIYTLYLKRATPQNIVIGGAAGAVPPVLGWTAVTGTITPDALALFLIIFVWTPPHFWALAIDKYREYEAVDIPMLPVTHGLAHTRTQILSYTLLLFPVSLLPVLIGMSGLLYLLGAVIAGGWFLVYAVRLKFAPEPGLGMRTFGYSIFYLMAIFALLLVDHYSPAIV